ncbi:hypothetical protein TNCT_678751, partial [Trichonephila clavata]
MVCGTTGNPTSDGIVERMTVRSMNACHTNIAILSPLVFLI